MIYYSKPYTMIKIDGRVSYALSILWRFECRPGELLRKMWSRFESVSSSESTAPGLSASTTRSTNYFATASATTITAGTSNSKASSSKHAVSTCAGY
jgi:hypothetical protein